MPENSKFFLNTKSPEFKGQVQPLMNAVNGEDPLPCALLCGALIDKCLVQILEVVFIEGNTQEKLLQPDMGLIGSIQNRANILYLLGHLPKRTFQNIGHICTIRNKFAHSAESLNFESESIAKLCDKLEMPTPIVIEVGDVPHDVTKQMDERLATPRHRFTWMSMQIIAELIGLRARIAEGKPAPSGG